MPTVCKITLDASQYRKELEKVVSESRSSAGQLAKTTASAPEGAAEKTASGLRGVWQEMTNLQGGAKRLVTSILAGGGAIGIIVAGVQGFCKACSAVYTLLTSSGKESAEQAARNADSIRETAAANEELRQKSDGYLSQLSALSRQEKLSNVDKANALKMIRDLTRSYGDMGISIDKATGKIVGLDAAMAKKAERDKAFRLAEIRQELNQIELEKQYHEERRDAAGFRLFGKWQIGGEETADNAAKRILELENQKAAALKKQREISGTDDAGDVLKKGAAFNEDLRVENNRRVKSFEERQEEDAIAALKTAEEKIANRNKQLEKIRRKISTLSDRRQAYSEDYAKAVVSGNAGDKNEARRNELQTERELQTAREKEYDIEHQIAELQRQKSEAVRKLLENSAYELQYSEAIASKDYDRAAALKLEKQLREQNLTLTKAQMDTLLQQEKLRKSQDLRNSLGDQAWSLMGKAMTAAGDGREFEELDALRSAKAKKGSDLTGEEKDMVLNLTALQRIVRRLRQQNPSVMNLRTVFLPQQESKWTL